MLFVTGDNIVGVGGLGAGMDAGIGAPGAVELRRLAGDLFKRLGQNALDGGPAGLDLPAEIPGAIVCQAQQEVPPRTKAFGCIIGSRHVHANRVAIPKPKAQHWVGPLNLFRNPN